MKRSPSVPLILTLALFATFAGCSRDPNVRKQKFFASGQSYFAQGKYPEAAIQFSNAIDIDPRFAEAHYQLAQADLKLQEWNQAYQELSRSVELQPENYPAHIDLANLLVSGHDFKHAQEQIDLLLARQPDNPLVHLAIANLLSAQDNLSGALEETKKAIALAPERSASYLSLALLEERANQPQAAEASFNRAIELNPGSADAHLALGTHQAARNRLADAEQQFRLAMAAEPKNPQPREAIAHLYLVQDKKAEAEAFLKQAKQDFAADPAGYRMLGDFYVSVGELDKAADEYSSLAHDHPGDWRVKKNYTQLLIVKNRLEEARKVDDEVLKSFPNDSDALIDRAQIQTRQGHPNDAVTTLQTVIKNDPDNAMAHDHLGLAFEQLGYLDQAQTEWKEALRLHPGMSEAQRSLAALALRTGNMGALEQSADRIIEQQPGSAEGYVMRALVPDPPRTARERRAGYSQSGQPGPAGCRTLHPDGESQAGREATEGCGKGLSTGPRA